MQPSGLTKWLNQKTKQRMPEKETQNTEQKILDAAEQVFMRDGYSGARMQDIADVAGINKALLHYYFRSKDKLFEMIFNAKFREFLPKIALILTQEGTVLDKLDMFIDTYMHMLTRNPYLPMFILNTINKDPDFVRHIPSELGTMFTTFINKEIAAGHIRQVQPHQLMMSILGMCLFPFVGRPMFMQVFSLNGAEYDAMILERKDHIKTYVRQILTVK